MLEIGSLIDGKYKILNEVGHGGMSVVYLAMNERANKQWAIKEVRKDGVKDFEVEQINGTFAFRDNPDIGIEIFQCLIFAAKGAVTVPAEQFHFQIKSSNKLSLLSSIQFS